jgi:hypothetical protein
MTARATAAEAQSAAGGTFHSIVIKSDGTVCEFVYNDVGSVGDGTWTDRELQVSRLRK